MRGLAGWSNFRTSYPRLYHDFKLGEFSFRRDEYFVYINWPTGEHMMSADAFLRALQRDVAWDFFYGTVNFDGVFGTVNHYGTVDMFAGRHNDAFEPAVGGAQLNRMLLTLHDKRFVKLDPDPPAEANPSPNPLSPWGRGLQTPALSPPSFPGKGVWGLG